MAPLALLRAVPDSFSRCVTFRELARPLDPAMARVQHAGYRAALESGGFETMVVPTDESHPDCPFIEDAVVAVGGKAFITRPGHPSRLGEIGPVADALAGLLPVEKAPEGAVIDGGDVLQVGGKLFAGVSTRTDPAGIAALAAAAGKPVAPVEVRAGLHLKSAITALDEETLLMQPGLVDPAPFAGFRIVETSPDEAHAANVVRLPGGAILAAAAATRTNEMLDGEGFEIHAVDVSEFARADGGLTCLSVRFRDR